MHTRHYHNGLKTTVLADNLPRQLAMPLPWERGSPWIFIFAGIDPSKSSGPIELRDYGLAFDECPSGNRARSSLRCIGLFASCHKSQSMPTLWEAPTMT